MKKCIYCKTQIDNDSVVDVCMRCGVGVWGPKMFNAIIENMSAAKEAGDLYQGTVSTTPSNSAQHKSKRHAEPDSELLKPASEDIPPLVELYPQPGSLDPDTELVIQPPAQAQENPEAEADSLLSDVFQ